MKDERARRISKMERLFDEVKKTVDLLDGAIAEFADAKDKIRVLDEYMSGEWLEDFEADGRGELPARLKRGVLAEDALYDLLADCDRLSKIIDMTNENGSPEP